MYPGARPDPRDTSRPGCLGYLFPPLAVLVCGGVFLWAVQPPAASALPVEAGPAGIDVRVDRSYETPGIAPIFTPEVEYWAASIVRWAEAADVDPNLAAVVMQIESCGNPAAVSRSGAQGLFQVMPFHFQPGENQRDPDVNAARGLAYLARSVEASEGEVRRSLAGYNGGISVIAMDESLWPEQTQRYVRYGAPIYADAVRGGPASQAIQDWYTRLGASLCASAARQLGLH